MAKTRAKGGRRAAKRAEAPTKKPRKKTGAKKVRRRAPEKKYGPRKDLGAAIDGYLRRLSGVVGDIVHEVVGIVRKAAPGAEAAIRWGMPVFAWNGPLCYVRAQAGYVRFGFYDHTRAMDDPEGRLEGGGNGRHVKLASLREIDRTRFASWVKTAARLNAAR